MTLCVPENVTWYVAFLTPVRSLVFGGGGEIAKKRKKKEKEGYNGITRLAELFLVLS